MSDPQCSQTQTLSCTLFLILELNATAYGLNQAFQTPHLALYFLVGNLYNATPKWSVCSKLRPANEAH